MWPNDPTWSALADGTTVDQNGRSIPLGVVDCGELVLNYGRLVVCDPFVFLEDAVGESITVPVGRYPVKVTLADFSDGSGVEHLREAYATILFSDTSEVRRRAIAPHADDEPETVIPEGEYIGFGVDAGTACFVDGGAIASGMPDSDWYDDVFDSVDEDVTSWFNLMDDARHIRPGLANAPLPLAEDGSNIILIRSGWGDGVYPVVGGYAADGSLVRVHIDFKVIGPNDDQSGDSDNEE